jgi:hypothetical protein
LIKRTAVEIPQELKIGGHIWEIVETNEAEVRKIASEEAEREIDSYTLGTYSTKRQKIYLNKEISLGLRTEVLSHEVIHIIAPGLSEEQTQHLAFDLHQVFTDNDLLK